MSPFESSNSSSSSSKLKLDNFSDYPLVSSLTMIPKDQSTLYTLSSSSSSKSLVQFFIRDFWGSSLVFVANLKDTVLEIHNRITSMTGIPITEQRFIFRGKQLQCDQTLDECGLVPDSTLQLLGRMRSFDHVYLRGRELVEAMVGLIIYVNQSGLDFDRYSYIDSYGLEKVSNDTVIKAFITRFFSMAKKSIRHLEIFMTSLAPRALVSLYNSVFSGNREIGEEAIKHFVDSIGNKLSEDTQRYCAPIVLEFCKLLGGSVGTNDSLYIFCRISLRGMVESFFSDGDYTCGIRGGKELIDVRDFFRFINELAGKLSHELVLSMGSEAFTGVSSDDIGDFALFIRGVRMGIMVKFGARNLAGKNDKESYKEIHYEEQMELLHEVFKDLLSKMKMCLKKMEFHLVMDKKENLEQMSSRWNQYLTILKVLNTISKMLEGAEELFWRTLGLRRVSFRYLIVRFAKISDDHKWILVRKDVTNFETRRHLIMMMFPHVEDEYDELYEMLIDRSKLLEESFEYIGNAEVESLHGGILVEFKNEKATGPGVLREWFFMVCGAIFNPQNALFVACPNDRRRFFPNPVSKIDPLHLEYFSFCGRIIALSLMHKIQIGIVFDRIFFVQLAGKNVSLEDICDADPYLYNSCKKILEMEADMVDQDVLGLTFIREVFELGTIKVVELCYGGKSISVTSRNREEYVNLLVQHSFVKPIAEQMDHFTRGFADIMNSDDTETRESLTQSFFESIDLEDLDWMLHGSESSLCVEDWMAHTKYVGFEKKDPQIRWFWKIVGEMSAEQRRSLLFFWTSIKYLPVEGFRGLVSRLSIDRSFESTNRLPSSQTCFYSLIFPPYPSEKVMQDRLDIITQEHVGFGAR